jgi:hypothetical protein
MEIEERLREIENRLMNTTPGPWKGEHEFNVTGRNGFVIGSFGSYFNTMMNQKELIWQKELNRRFIINAPEDTRWMLDLIYKLLATEEGE